MEIRKKTLLIVSITIIALMALLTLVSSFVILQDYARLEEQVAVRNLRRAESTIGETLSHLDSTAYDWASWDDTYTFVEDGNQPFIASNLMDKTFVGLDIHAMLFYNTSGALVWGKGYDLENRTAVPIAPGLLAEARPGSPLLAPEPRAGILQLPDGPMLVASRPILTSEDGGPRRGSLIMGRYLDADLVAHTGEVTALSLAVLPLGDTAVPSAVLHDDAPVVQPVSPTTVAAHSVLSDIHGSPASVLRAEMPRDIYRQGEASTFSFTLIILSVCLVFGLVTLFALEKLALLPLATLNASVARIGSEADPGARLSVHGDDELAHLGMTINRMLEALEQTQKAHQEGERRYRAVVEDQIEFISRYLPDGTHIFVNEAYCRYFGKDRSEILGRVFRPAIPEEDREPLRRHFASLSRENPVATIEHRIVMPGGEVRWQQWTDRVILDADGRIAEYQSVGRDVTDRRRIEEALHRANEKLNLLGSVTRHDLLNQLTAIQGYVQLAAEFGTDPRIRKYLDTAAEVSRKMQDLIRFSRDYQNMGIHMPVWQSVREIAQSAAASLPLNRVNLHLDLDGLEIYADPLLEKVFYNLIENALRHGGETLSEIRIGYRRDGEHVVVTCEDDGVGVPVAEKEVIFRQGYGRNTGYGLFLIREILGITGIAIRECGERGARFEMRVPPEAYRISGVRPSGNGGI
ncbi:MAG: CHASE4 domain-containing protein [Methanomicrobiales archaeon]|nr:CHASE4 domain-containing protein [Methanomicrobiales archaeon]